MNTNKTPKIVLLLIAFLLLAFSFLLASPPARAADSPADVTHLGTLLTNTTLCVTNATTNTLNGAAFYVRKNQGAAITLLMNTTNTAADDLVYLKFQVSADKTNWNTLNRYAIAPALNGTTSVVLYTNLVPTLLNNVRWIRLQSIGTAGTNSLWISNLWYSYHN